MRARGGLNGLHDARRLLRTLTGTALELLAGALGPGLRSRGAQVLLEVVGGARGIRTVDRLDVGVGQGGAAVERGDGRVVPLGDLTLEDLGQHVAVDDELVDALDVVGHRDRAEHQRKVPRRVAAAALGCLRGLLVVQRRVGTGEVDLLGDELVTPAPEPVGLYDSVLPGQTWPHTLLNSAMAFCWAVEPSAVSEVLPPQSAAPDADAPSRALLEAVPALLSLPHAVRVRAAMAVETGHASGFRPCCQSD